MINDILDLAKIGAEKMELAFESVELVAIVQESLRLINQSARRKNLRIVTSFDSAVGKIRADGRSFKQILVNLLSNAVKFTPDGGAIGLDIVGDTAERVIHCTVWDTGIGIAEGDLKRIFQPFVQLDGRLARQYGGTGLGLALVARMVDLHRGSIAVASSVGQGSRFTVTLPWDTAGAAASALPDDAARTGEVERPPAARASSPLILVAEDNLANLEMLTEFLTRRGYQVAVAHDGAAAVAQTRAVRPELILMDIQMPGMDGLEAIRCIRADPSVASVPIVALTALVMPSDREQCLAAGATTYLSKPVRLRELTTTIETYCAGSPPER
jgi:CheY-like chemotaxis protein